VKAPLFAVASAFLLAGVPVAAAALAGRTSPMYARPARDYLCWWTWGALLILVAAYLLAVI
jgi:hypothetical protein